MEEQVIVQVAARYLSPKLQAIAADVGDVVTILGGTYADGLVQKGFVERTLAVTAVADPGDGEESEAVATMTDELAALPGVGPEIADALRAAGYGTVTAVRAATDRDLLGISGIGKKTLAAIRTAVEGA